jgi:hypothetical protein
MGHGPKRGKRGAVDVDDDHTGVAGGGLRQQRQQTIERPLA